MRLKQTGTISGCVQRDQSLICRFTARIFQIVNRSLFQKLKHIWLILLKTEWPAPATTGDVASAASKQGSSAGAVMVGLCLHTWFLPVSGAELGATACSLCWNSKGILGSCSAVQWTRPQPLKLLLWQLESTELMERGSDWKSHFLVTVNFLN